MKTLYDKIAPHLWDGKSPYSRQSSHICIAITTAHKEVPLKARDWLREKIREGLHDKFSVRDWARARGYLDGMTPERATEQLQAFRARWLKHLCEEYERENAVR